MRELWCSVARERQPVHQEASSPQRRDIVSIRIQQSVDQVHGSTVLDFQVTYITVTVQPGARVSLPVSIVYFPGVQLDPHRLQ